jgi:hypothetical protein
MIFEKTSLRQPHVTSCPGSFQRAHLRALLKFAPDKPPRFGKHRVTALPGLVRSADPRSNVVGSALAWTMSSTTVVPSPRDNRLHLPEDILYTSFVIFKKCYHSADFAGNPILAGLVTLTHMRHVVIVRRQTISGSARDNPRKRSPGKKIVPGNHEEGGLQGRVGSSRRVAERFRMPRWLTKHWVSPAPRKS